jgi:flagellar biosynthetic protein FliO
METFRVIVSLLVVFGLMGAVLWGLKKMQSRITQAVPGRRLQILESAGIGARQKLALVRVDGHEFLVGISPGHMTALGQWGADAPQSPAESSEAGAVAGVPGDAYPMTAQALLERESRREA